MMQSASAPLGRPGTAKVATAAGWGLLTLSVIVLVGWAFDLRGLENFVAESAGSKANSAVAMMFAAVALLRRDHRDLPIFSIFVSLIGVLTLGEYFWNTNFGIDELLVRDTHYFIYPGRMTQYTASGLVLLGASLLPMNSRYTLMRRLSRYLGFLTGAFGALAIVSHAYDRHTPNLSRPGASVAIPTAIGFVIGAIGVQYANPSEGFVRLFHADSAGGAMLRRLLPAGVLLSALLGLVVVHAQVLYHWETGFSLALVGVGVSACLTTGIVLTAAILDRRDLAYKTQRKLAEEALSRYAAIVESSDDAIAGIDIDGTIRNWNKGAERLYGFTAEEAIGRPVSLTSPADRPKEALEIFDKVRSGKLVLHYETTRQRKDGTLVEVAVTASPIVDAEGRVVGASGIARDITERKQAETKMRESEEQFRTLAEAIPQLCWMAHGDGRNLWNNQRWYSYTGTTPEQMEGWGWQSVHDPQTLPTALERWNASIMKGEPFDMIAPLRGADGVFRQFLTRAMPLKDADKRVMRWFGTCTDVTELRDAHEKRYHQLFENMAEGIAYCRMLFDDSGRPADFLCLEVNTAFPKLTGLKDAAGKRMTELIPGIRESNPELFETYGRVVVTGQPERLEIEIKPLGIWLSTSVHSPEEGHFVAVFDNITERKRSEEILLRAEKLTSAGRMAAAIAHEINNPLDAVMNLLFLAATTKELPESVQHLLETADDELKRVAHITRQSLGFYRESSTPTVFPVSAVLNSALDMVKSRIKLKQAIIEKQFDRDVQITAIEGELRQVFSNLLSNSLDAIGERGTIKLRVSAGRQRVRVTVADNGKGVPRSIRRRVFEPFFSTKGTVGTGLGLWVSQQIIEKHGGTIRVRSNSDGLRKGTTFSVVLPLAPVSSEGQLTIALDVGNDPEKLTT